MLTVKSGVKKRVLWYNDGPTPDVSSLSFLIDWFTTGDNYSRRARCVWLQVLRWWFSAWGLWMSLLVLNVVVLFQGLYACHCERTSTRSVQDTIRGRATTLLYSWCAIIALESLQPMWHN